MYEWKLHVEVASKGPSHDKFKLANMLAKCWQEQRQISFVAKFASSCLPTFALSFTHQLVVSNLCLALIPSSLSWLSLLQVTSNVSQIWFIPICYCNKIIITFYIQYLFIFFFLLIVQFQKISIPPPRREFHHIGPPHPFGFSILEQHWKPPHPSGNCYELSTTPPYPLEISFIARNNKQEVVSYCRAYIRDIVANVVYTRKVKVVNQLK